MEFIRKNINQRVANGINVSSSHITTGVASSGTSSKDCVEWVNVKDFGAVGNGINDDGDSIQNAINYAYEVKKPVYFPAGTYQVTRTLWVYDGLQLMGAGIYNTIIKTPFAKTDIAKSYVTRDKNKAYRTATNPDTMPEFDYSNGHNRFYIGDGVVGYYDSDRETNTSHPLYWANDNSEAFRKWKAERDKIQSQGRWVGRTGREGYGGAVFKSSQVPGLKYEDYSPTHKLPQGTIHTGIRNVKFADLQINSNSSDRGKDSAIDFQYKATDIPSQIRETYDSSVLNIQLYNLYLFSLGKSGYRATRAVDHTIIGCYVRQCAETGFYLDGVTSIFFTGCYCNSCIEGGYVLKGCNYSAFNSCAADSCSIGYKIYNCNGVSLNSCGCEATRYEKAPEVDEEDPYKGRAFVIQNSKGISLISPYTMSSHPKLYSDEAIDLTDDEQDPNWLKSRHVFVSESQNVQIAYPYFKCFQRVRSTPYRDANNVKVNYQGGTYDATQYGSRYWQVQSYLVGAQYEVRGESSSVHIIAGETKESLCKDSEIRTGNLDLLDLGLVENPLISEGFITAGRTMSGEDGNGGWVRLKDVEEDVLDGEGNVVGTTTRQVEERVTFENFEFVFPINAKKLFGVRDKFWAWRNSLILVRKKDDSSLANTNKYGQKYVGRSNGYVSYFKPFTSINWANVSQADLRRFKIDIVDDCSDTTFIDGDKNLFSFGRFSWQQLDSPIAYEPSVFSPIPCYVRDKPEGNRLTINSNSIDGYPTEVNKAAVSIIGNKYVAPTDTITEVIPGSALAILSRRKQSDMATDRKAKAMFITNLEGKDILSVFEKNLDEKAFSVKGFELISTKTSDYNYINKLPNTASNTQIVNVLNALIDRMANHGFIIKPEEGAITFGDISTSGSNSSEAQITFKVVNTGTQVVYRAGLAYSGTNNAPTASNNKQYATINEDESYTANLSYGSDNFRYVRFFVETTQEGGESNRLYSVETYVLYYHLGNAYLVELDDYEQPQESNCVPLNYSLTSYNNESTNIRFVLSCNGYTHNSQLGEVGVAYSSTNQNPTVSQNVCTATTTGTFEEYEDAEWDLDQPITYGSNDMRYLRFFCHRNGSTAIYSEPYVLYYAFGSPHLELLADFEGMPDDSNLTLLQANSSNGNSQSTGLNFKLQLGTTGHYEILRECGIAYSSTSKNPTISHNSINASLDLSSMSELTSTWIIDEPLNLDSNKRRYVRFYCKPWGDYIYTSTYVVFWHNNQILITPLNVYEDDYENQGGNQGGEEPVEGAITFSNVVMQSYTSSAGTIRFDVTNTTSDDIYSVGAAYSPSNTTPTYNNNHVSANLLENGSYLTSITYGSSGTRYIRFYVNKSAESSESNRVYSETYIMRYENNTATIAKYIP